MKRFYPPVARLSPQPAPTSAAASHSGTQSSPGDTLNLPSSITLYLSTSPTVLGRIWTGETKTMKRVCTTVLFIFAAALDVQANRTCALGDGYSTRRLARPYEFDRHLDVQKTCIFPAFDGSCKGNVTFRLVEIPRHRRTVVGPRSRTQ